MLTTYGGGLREGDFQVSSICKARSRATNARVAEIVLLALRAWFRWDRITSGRHARTCGGDPRRSPGAWARKRPGVGKAVQYERAI